jgi:hypothetical protein
MVSAPVAAPAGGTVMVWVDEAGRLTGPPLPPSLIRGQAMLAAILAALAFAIIMVCAGLLARIALDRRRLAAWDAEWRGHRPAMDQAALSPEVHSRSSPARISPWKSGWANSKTMGCTQPPTGGPSAWPGRASGRGTGPLARLARPGEATESTAASEGPARCDVMPCTPGRDRQRAILVTLTSSART